MTDEIKRSLAQGIEAVLPELGEGVTVESLLSILKGEVPKEPEPSPQFYMKTVDVDKLALTCEGRVRVPFRSMSPQEKELFEDIFHNGIKSALTLRREQNGDLLLHDGLARLMAAKNYKIEYLPVRVMIDMPALLQVIL